LADSGKASTWAIAATIAVGLIVGLLSGWWAITGGMGGQNYRGWYGSSVTGSTDAGPWLRARVAISGLLALNKSQAIYFTRKTDDAGEPLREECRYRVSGGALPGQWWSVTVYAADNFLPVNTDDALSFDATEVQTGPRTVPGPRPAMRAHSTSPCGYISPARRLGPISARSRCPG
jgi:hypothetical protein